MGDMGEGFGMGDDAHAGTAAAVPNKEPTCSTCAEIQAALEKAQRQAKHYRKQREKVKAERDVALGRAAKSEKKVKAFLGD